MIRFFACLISVAILSFCQAQPNVQDPALLDSIIHYGEDTSVLRDSVDWEKIRASMTSIHDTSGIIPAAQFMLKELGDFHGRIFYKNIPYNGLIKDWIPSTMKFDSLTIAQYRQGTTPLHGELINPTVGYIRIPSIRMGQDSLNAHSIYNTIDSLKKASKGLTGFIVDLRLNGGGTMYPMLAGMSPFFGEDAVGFFLDPAANYKEHWLVSDGNMSFQIEGQEPYWSSDYGIDAHLDLRRLPIAVLTGRSTTSSGEVCAIAFHGRANTKSFGEPTGAYTTTVSWIPLSEDVVLQVTESYYADRNEHLYKGTPVIPDVVMEGPANFMDLKTDKYVLSALDYLQAK